MTIKFVCSCGKRLRARDAMAARRSRCPRCGMPVGIPALEPTHPGAPLGHMTPAERLRYQSRTPGVLPHTFGQVTAVQADPEADKVCIVPDELPPAVTAAPTCAPEPVVRPPRRRLLPKPLVLCLLYPVRAGLVITALAFVFAAVVAGVAVLPGAFGEIPDSPLEFWLRFGTAVLLVAAALGYGGAFLSCTQSGAAAGQLTCLHWPGNEYRLIWKYTIMWLGSLLCGPSLLFALAWYYWLRCGVPNVLDWFILTDLIGLAGFYWILSVAAAGESGRLRDLRPRRAAQLAERLGARTTIVLGVALSTVLGIRIAAVSISNLHEQPRNALLLLFGVNLMGLTILSILFRFMGLWLRSTPPDNRGA